MNGSSDCGVEARPRHCAGYGEESLKVWGSGAGVEKFYLEQTGLSAAVQLARGVISKLHLRQITAAPSPCRCDRGAPRSPNGSLTGDSYKWYITKGTQVITQAETQSPFLLLFSRGHVGKWSLCFKDA